MSRKPKTAPKKTGITKIAADQFDSTVPQIIAEYKDKLDELNEDDLQKEVVNMGNDCVKALEAALPDYKIITHAMVFAKGPASLYDAWCTHWEVDKDSMCVTRDETPKHHIMVYGLFYPLKVPEEYQQ